MTIRFVTLGCKVNQYETQAMSEAFIESGFEITEQNADIIVINSCTVTSTADKKTRQTVRKLKRENPSAIVALTGCMPQSSPQNAISIDEADVITGSKNRRLVVEAVSKRISTGQRVVDIMPHLPNDKFEALSVMGFNGHRRAFIKIQDGCDRYCAYCIIPTARGHLRSKPPDDIAKEAEELVKRGFKELVLVGINLAMYGCDLNLDLADGVNAACCFEGEYRVRLGSTEPDLLTEQLLQKLYINKHLCPHFHVPLQSGCDETLKRMNRRYNTQQYKDVISRIREIWGNQVAISTDIIVGFPSESEEEFEKTLEFSQTIGFSDAHIFEFSPRDNTPASLMKHQISPDIKSKRNTELSKVISRESKSFIEKQVGTMCNVFVENCGNAGYNQFYTYVKMSNQMSLAGKLVTVKINSFEDGICKADVV